MTDAPPPFVGQGRRALLRRIAKRQDSDIGCMIQAEVACEAGRSSTNLAELVKLGLVDEKPRISKLGVKWVDLEVTNLGRRALLNERRAAGNGQFPFFPKKARPAEE